MKHVLRGVALLLLAFPIWLALVGSLGPERELFGAPALWPAHPTLEHYRALWSEPAFLAGMRSSLIVALSTTLLCIALGAPCAYALARLDFRGRRALSAAILAVGMFPQISILSPLYLALRWAGLVDTTPGLVLPYLTFAMPLAVWLLAAHFRALPATLEHAAWIDGASRLATLRHVVFPLALPGIATTAILVFVYAWNEFLFALSFTLGPAHQTVPVAIALLRGRYQVPWGEVLAAALVATLPVAVAVLAFQRRIARSFAPGPG